MTLKQEYKQAVKQGTFTGTYKEWLDKQNKLCDLILYALRNVK
mgnify:CR=1 FL=1